MVDKTTSKYLSKREKAIFDALANWDTIKAAAHSLGLSPSTLYNWRSDLKDRYRKRRGWINAVLAQTKRGGKCADLLQEKRQMKPPDKDEELEEDWTSMEVEE